MKSHGGARKGAGRKPGRTVKTVSITLSPDDLAKLDRLRGGDSRGSWIAERIRKAK